MKKILFFTAVFIFLAGLGWGQVEFTWTGLGGDNDWDNQGNWNIHDPGSIIIAGYPGSDSSRVDDIVIIEDDILSPGAQFPSHDILISKLLINNNSNVTIDTKGENFTITDTITLNGDIKIESNGGQITFKDIGGIGDIELDAGSGNIIITGDTSTVGNQIYTGAVTLDGTGDTRTLSGTTVTLGTINGNGKSLTISDSGTLHGGNGIVDLNVNGSFTLSTNPLSAATVEVTGTSSIGANISTTGDQTYTGIVTLTGTGTKTLTGGTTVTLGTINGGGNSLAINGDDVLLHGGNNINTLSVSGTTIIGANITTTGTQTYTGAVTLDGTGTKILTGTTVTLGIITGNDNSLTITGNAVLTTGGSGIEDLKVSGNFNLTGGSLSTETVDVNTVSGTSSIAADITTVGTQKYAGTVTLVGTGATRTLTGTTVTLGTITGNGNSLTITGKGVLNGGGNGIGDLSVSGDFNLASGSLSTAKVNVTGTSSIAGNITSAGDQTYTGAVTLSGSRIITSNSGNIEFKNTLEVTTKTSDKIELSALGGEITVAGKIEAYQLIARAYGIVTVGEIEIDSSNHGNEEISAAIYIKADNFVVTSTTVDSIIPGGPGGQLCLYLKNTWTNPNGVVTGDENIRWHQHYIDLKEKHLVYGDVPQGFPLSPDDYVHIKANDVKKEFILDINFNVYINDADNVNASGPWVNLDLEFTTSGIGAIEFSGTNIFNKIALETGAGGIRLVDTDITVKNGGFELARSERITLMGNPPSGTISSINAAKITLNNINSSENKGLELTTPTATGEITFKGNVGISSARLGDITVVSANKVTISGNIYANSINITSTGTTIGANITTTGTQTYTGAVTLDGTGAVRTLTGATVTLVAITGGGNSLTITGDGILHGVGTGINILSVSGTAKIGANITTTGTQTYTGAVTLDGTGAVRTLTGATVTLGTITGNNNSLTITGNGVLHGGTGINTLTVTKDFSLTDSTLSAASVSVNTTTGKSYIAEDITTTGAQTYSGAVELGGGDRILTSSSGATVTLGTITGNDNSLTITGNCVLIGGGSDIGDLSVSGTFSLTGGSLSTAKVNVTGTGTSNITGNITAAGDQTYNGAVTLTGTKLTITSQNGNIEFKSTLQNSTVKIELLATGGNITVAGKIEAQQLIAKATGNVTVNEIGIDTSNTGNEGINAAIYIEADNFIVTSTTANSIVPGGTAGQLCLVLKNTWTNTNGVVDGNEDDPNNLGLVPGARWHQHYGHFLIDFSGKHLVYGSIPSSLTPLPSGYAHIQVTDTRTQFILDSGKNVYINDADNNNTSGLVFKTSGMGFIQFSGTNEFEKITLETGNGGIRLVDTDIKVNTSGFELTHGEGITLMASSPSGTGSSIEALNITLNGITTAVNKNLTLTATGEINLKGDIGTNTARLGDIIAGTNKVILSGNIYANSINITSTGTTIGSNITTTGTQTYTGAVTLGGTGAVRTLSGTNVTLGTITGGGKSLTITGNGVLNGGSGINVLSVSGTSTINQDITTTGNQTYTGAATLSGSLRKIISQSGSIEFKSTLSSTGIIDLSSAKDITIGGGTSASQLLATAVGVVKVYTVNTTHTGNEGINAAIFIQAANFVVTSTTANSIVPGGAGGQLCLNLNTSWKDINNVIDGNEDIDPDHPSSTYRWHQHIPSGTGRILYSFTEDSNGNGRLDRIRVQTDVQLNGDFHSFEVSVEGYEVDKNKVNTVKGYVLDYTTPSDLDSFYIYLKEKPELDGGNIPSWSIIENNSLMDTAGKYMVSYDPAVGFIKPPIDTIPPRIAYTLTLPLGKQTYVRMSEPVASFPLTSVSFDSSYGSVAMSMEPQSNLGYLFSYPTKSHGVDELAKLNSIDNALVVSGYFQMSNITDKSVSAAPEPGYLPKYPIDWGYTKYEKVTNQNDTPVFAPPNKLLTVDMTRKLANNQSATVTPSKSGPVTRRVTDVLVSIVSTAAEDKYFVWPIWAKPSGGSDTVMKFDGSTGIEKSSVEKAGSIDLHASISKNLTGIGSPELFWTTANIPADYRNPQEASGNRKAGGLWLPNNVAAPLLYYYAPLSNGINKLSANSSPPPLYTIAANAIVMGNNAKFEFVFRLGSSDMLIARLDGSESASNWYTLIRPFAFDITSVRRQSGGVTIMNNVINSNNRETVFIRYNLLRPGRVTVQIYTLDGTLVKSLKRNVQCDAGEWTDSWDGTNNGGRAVARGMYFVRVVGPDIDEIRKIMVVK